MSLLANLIYLVTDCDKTLVHYEQYDRSDSSLTAMPPSSGSKRVGWISNKSLNLLQKLSELTTIICVSGMRYSTMIQRQPYFPFIKYWICDNGGQIFEVSEDGKLHKIMEWDDYSIANGKAAKLTVLDSYAANLLDLGWTVDREGYDTMIRVKPPASMDETTLNHILSNLPNELRYTYNLGYLDIYLSGYGKHAAVSWLIDRLSTTTVTTSTDTTPSPSLSYYFLGDDTNDIEIASHAQIASIVTPCSIPMRSWLNEQSTNNILYTLAHDIPHNSDPSTDMLGDNRVYTTSYEGYDATETLLDNYLRIFSGQNNDLKGEDL